MEDKKIGFQDRMKRLLIGFFIAMFVLTILSRAADSMTVGKVTVINAKSGELTFNLYSKGSVKGNVEKRIKLKNGFIIDKILVEEGDKVSKGDVLFYYNLEPAKKQLEGLNKELKKLKLDYEKASISGSADSSDGSAVETAKRQVELAKEDLKSVKEEEKNIKETVKEKKEEELKQAKAEQELVAEQKKAAMKEAKRTVEDTSKAVEQYRDAQQKIKDRLDSYGYASVIKDYIAVARERDALLKLYLGDGYFEYQNNVDRASKAVARAKEDLEDIIAKWNKLINEDDRYSADEEVVKNYEQQVAGRDSEIKSARRNIDDLTDALSASMQEEKELDDLLGAYQRALTGTNTDSTIPYEKVLNKIFNKVNPSAASEETLLKTAGRAKEDYEALEDLWKEKEKEAQEQVEEKEQVLESIKKDTYDYTKELREWENSVKQAQRALEQAELSLTQALEAKEQGIEEKQTLQKGNELTLQGLKLDIEDKQTEIKELEDLLQGKGAVKAPKNGTVLEMELEEGNTVAGQEKVILVMDGFELEAKLPEEELKKFEPGDPMKVTIGKSKTADTYVDQISSPDEEDMVILTASLPKGNYKVNATLPFTISKDSEVYQQCIPVEALRQDSRGTFVLYLSEKEGILGKETIALRMEVTVIERDSKNAAVEAAFDTTTQIISGSSKNIEEGDRVRVDEQA